MNFTVLQNANRQVRPMRAIQRGLSLVIVMLFLSAITGITIWAVRQSILGEGLARNQLDQEVARQAAESALRDAERDIMNFNANILTNASCTRGRDRPPLAVDFTDTCTTGLCIYNELRYANADWTAKDATLAEPWWPVGRGGRWNNTFSNKPGRAPVTTTNCTTFTGGVPFGTYTGTTAIVGVAVQPEYLIEYFRRSNQVTYQPTNTYRITARGFGYTQRTQVVLQTIYVPLQE
jgi:type IV pilus assembly protein PilX